MLNVFIVVCRFPVAVVLILLTVVFWGGIVWPLEFLSGLVLFPFQAVFSARHDLKAQYAQWPFRSLNSARESIDAAWFWVTNN